MTKYLLAAVMIILGGYGSIEAWPLVAGPSLSLSSPAEHASFPGGIVDIRGEAGRTAQLTQGGAPVLRDKDGSFSSTLTFPSGGSILTFVATDRFGRTVAATRSIFVPADTSVGSPTSDVGSN